ncbi:hypothetical protein PUN28_004872 [Cardiocondyla obscurior]|uniref:Uncharacterized protein n=1 Tax=Cardiocondyla obscurior TaxID=286306 RepID=A0AAW2GHL3_9HYME
MLIILSSINNLPNTSSSSGYHPLDTVLWTPSSGHRPLDTVLWIPSSGHRLVVAHRCPQAQENASVVANCLVRNPSHHREGKRGKTGTLSETFPKQLVSQDEPTAHSAVSCFCLRLWVP